MSSFEGRAREPGRGLDADIIRAISAMRGEPDWMLGIRLASLRRFEERPVPRWVGDLPGVDLGAISLRAGPAGGRTNDRGRLPPGTGDAFREPGGAGADRRHRPGAAGWLESEMVFDRAHADLEARGVIFCDLDAALRDHPELVRAHFGTIVSMDDNKFSALNTAVWSGGSFIYVPPGVEVDVPLQAYSRDEAGTRGQFGRTLIVADEGSRIRYIEGCSAPIYSPDPLHAAVVEIVVKPGAHVTHTTIQNWSDNVVNLATKRASVEAEGHMVWIDGNIGSRLTMTYPAVHLIGPRSHGEALSVACAGPGQQQDTGARMVHAAPETSSKIMSRSVARGGGRSGYRALVRVEDDVGGCSGDVRCDALVLDDESICEAFPRLQTGNTEARIGSGTTVSRVSDGQLFYLMSRGLSEQQAIAMVVNGFVEPVTRTLPLEYAVEWSRLIELQMGGSVG